MALSDLFSGDSGSGWGDMMGSLAGLYGNVQGYQNASNVGNQVSGAIGQNLGAVGGNISGLQQQNALAQQQAQQAYAAARGNVDTQNQGLQGDINTMTTNLNALSDPNSPYMQMARQAIERKDAASGRRSQWGDREVQLAAQLADYVGKYSPGMQSSITNARNQINQNNMGLASIFSTMNNPNANGQSSLAQMLQQQLTGANTANTTGRQAANSQTNNLTGLLTNGGKLLGGLGSLFGNSGGSNILSSLFNAGSSSGFGDGSLWGNSFQPMSDYGIDTGGLGGYGFGNLPAGDYFGGGGIGGVPTAWDGGDAGGGGWDDIW